MAPLSFMHESDIRKKSRFYDLWLAYGFGRGPSYFTNYFGAFTHFDDRSDDLFFAES